MAGGAIPITIRPMRPGDAPFVFDSWANSLADELEIEGAEMRKLFRSQQIPILRRLVDQSTVWVATSTRDDDALLGWSCTDGDILHFVFTKRDFRKYRICARLLTHAGLRTVARASHATHWGFPRVARLFDSLTHDPTLGIPR